MDFNVQSRFRFKHDHCVLFVIEMLRPLSLSATVPSQVPSMHYCFFSLVFVSSLLHRLVRSVPFFCSLSYFTHDPDVNTGPLMSIVKQINSHSNDMNVITACDVQHLRF